MLPGDQKPWAKSVARLVVLLSVTAAVVGAYFLYDIKMLHVPETLIILLLLLTIVPPNLAIIRRRSADDSANAAKPTAKPRIVEHHAR